MNVDVTLRDGDSPLVLTLGLLVSFCLPWTLVFICDIVCAFRDKKGFVKHRLTTSPHALERIRLRADASYTPSLRRGVFPDSDLRTEVGIPSAGEAEVSPTSSPRPDVFLH